MRIGGIIETTLNGVLMNCKGDFTLRMAPIQATSVMGSDGKRHGIREEAIAQGIDGKITDRGNMDLIALTKVRGGSLVFKEANGNSYLLKDADYVGDGTKTTMEGEFDFKFDGEWEKL